MMLRITTIVLAAALLTSAAIAQNPRFAQLHVMLPKCDEETPALLLGDLDGDGDLDVLTSHRLFLNGGAGSFADRTATHLPPGHAASALAQGDVDGDGDLDVLVGTTDQNRLYLNDGSGVFTDATSTHLPAVSDPTSDLALWDLDGDGDLDVLVGNDGQQNGLLLNDGAGVFTDATATRLPVDSDPTRSIALGDLDGDGDWDALIGNAGYCSWYGNCPSSQNRVYLNDGTGTFVDATTACLPSTLEETEAVLLHDIDGDGDLDAVIGNLWSNGLPGWIPPMDGENQLYVNDGTGVFTIVTLPGVYGTRDFALGDVDGDGSQDLMVGNGGQNHLYLFASTGILDVTATHLPQISEKTRSLALGDVDGDGDLDALIGNKGRDRLYLNDGAGVFSDVSQADLPGASDVTFSLGDVDGDGDLDAFAGNVAQDHLLVNDGFGSFDDLFVADLPSFVACYPMSEPTEAVALGDVDGDGDLDALTAWAYEDLMCGAWGGRLCQNDGSGVFTIATANSLPPSFGGTSVEFGDLDADGDLDVLGSGGLYLNDGQGIFSDVTATNLPSNHGGWSLALGDVDGDGDLDALIGNPRSLWTPAQNRLYLNDGTGTFTEVTGTHMPLDIDLTRAVALGDVDGDLDLDALIGNAGQNRLYVNDGSGVFTDATATHLPPDSDETNAAALGDVDGDGDLDAIFGNGSAAAGQQNRLYLNDGSGHFSDATPASLPLRPESTRAVALGDLDGDGDLDALIGNRGPNRLLRNLTHQLAWHALPRFAKPLTIDVYGPPNQPWILGASATTASIAAPPIGTLRLDPTSLFLLGSGFLDAQGRASVTFAIPPNPGGAAGLTVYGQALVGIFPRLTNLERFTFTDL